MFMLMELCHPCNRESGGKGNVEIRMMRDSTKGNMNESTFLNLAKF
jgi:hypothetical protein